MTDKDDKGKRRMGLVPVRALSFLGYLTPEEYQVILAIQQGKADMEIVEALEALLCRPNLADLEDIALVMEHGAEKYTDHGWRDVPNAKARYFDAFVRHALEGDSTDPESGLPHAHHSLACAAILLELYSDE